MKKLLLITASLFAVTTANASDHDMLANYNAKDITVLFEVADKNQDNMLSVEEVKASARLIVELAEELDDKYEEENDTDRKKDGFWDIF
tara:strand:- start:240 stop:506 length:267 start_codon:yes stop_codon:yes gene_type:complete